MKPIIYVMQFIRDAVQRQRGPESGRNRSDQVRDVGIELHDEYGS